MDIGLETITNSSKYGEAFRNKPLILKTQAEVCAFLEGKMHKNMTLLEDTCTLSTNNSYRNYTTYEVDSDDKDKTFLDLSFLIGDDTSSLKGTLDSEDDIDFYNFTIPYNRTYQNYFNIEIQMELPEGVNYSLTLYDEYGNQVGMAEWNGDFQKTLNIPNWDTKTSKYCIKIENEDGESISPEDCYKISFRVSDSTDTEKTDAVREAFIKYSIDYSQKTDGWEESLAEYNRLLKKIEINYSKEVEQLHDRQYNSLPNEKKYTGDRTIEELLQNMANGKSLSEAELEYVKIYANLRDYEKAQQQSQLQGEFSKEFSDDLENMNISPQDLENMQVRIESNGTVSVEGVEDEAVKKQVESLITEKYSDQLYRYYIGIADSVENLPSNVYQFAVNVQEVDRFLKDVAGEEVSLENLYIMSDGKIGGLPYGISDMINNTKDNAKIEEIRSMLRNIIGYKRIYSASSIPYFTSTFCYDKGKFSVIDSGFASDVEELSIKMTSILSTNNMYAGVYKYNFKKIL